MIQKIVLVGYMGSGKSTIGALLAKKRQLLFIDLDNYIETKENLTVAEIFLQKGEIYFRKTENKYFLDLMQNKTAFVLSLGGGTPCYANNHLLLQSAHCQSFYLQTSVNTLVARLQIAKQNRPLIAKLSRDQLFDFVAKQSFERNYFYMFSKNIIKTDHLTLNEIIEAIDQKIF